jgi:hypothetical protein
MPAMLRAFAFAMCLASVTAPVVAQDGSDLARQLSNPVANLISVPLQFNLDSGFGTTDADRLLLNVQPVIPFGISADWNIISRTIVPVVAIDPLFPGATSTSGIGDIVQSFFLSPSEPTASGLIWGAGPVILAPTATQDGLGAGVWGLGPTAVALRQQGGLTIGGLANHIWSLDPDDTQISATFLQPFVSITTPTATSYGGNIEASYDWLSDQWTASANVTAGQLVSFGGAPLQLTGGLRYWLASPAGGPDGLGVRFVVTFLFPT